MSKSFESRLRKLEYELQPVNRNMVGIPLRELTDNELAETIGGTGCDPESLTDDYLHSLCEVTDSLPIS